jgi:uncharacterized delta-60 repeat protein
MRRLWRIVSVAAMLVVLWVAMAFAAAGDLDTSFNGTGVAPVAFVGRASDVAVGNWKIVAVGWTIVDGRKEFALARYRQNGTLDPNFSGDGKQITRFGSNAGATDIAIQCTRVAIQCNRKILVAGVGEGTEFALARYHRDGTLDTTFSADGKQAKRLAPNDYEYGAYGVALGSGGRIYVVGDGEVAGHGAIALARFNRDGTLDTLFSGDGKQFTLIGDSAEGRAIAIQDDGKIVVASNAYVSGQHEFAAARYLGHN